MMGHYPRLQDDVCRCQQQSGLQVTDQGASEPRSHRLVSVLHMQVEELLQECSNGGAAVPQVGYIHFSPPCQELSARKKEEQRRFSGRTLM